MFYLGLLVGIAIGMLLEKVLQRAASMMSHGKHR